MPISLFAFAAGLTLAPLFGDHMILQRAQKNTIWGEDSGPGSIRIELAREGVPGQPIARIETKTDENGHWTVLLPSMDAGGPYRLLIQGSSQRELRDVYFGEVWLASGQSNMEWRVKDTLNAALEMRTARDPLIRQFEVQRCVSEKPLREAQGTWLCATPQTVGGFSAVAYYFARELRQREGVPVGIVHASWGGTRIEAWGSREAFEPLLPASEFAPSGSQSQAAVLAEHAMVTTAWELRCLPSDPGNTGVNRGWAGRDFDDATWKVMRVPGMWQAQGLNCNGVVWFRRCIDIPSTWVNQDLCLSLGTLDDFDITYFNGVEIGSHPKGTPSAYRLPRNYTIPASLVKAGKAVIAVRIFDHYGQGGFSGQSSDLRLAPSGQPMEAQALDGPWSYALEHWLDPVPSEVFRDFPSVPVNLEPANRASVLFNGMIAPLIPYGIRGAIWYQGESNADASFVHYGTRFQAMIRDWRARWGQGNFPFLYVQLSNFTSGSPWVAVRELQTQTLSLPNTGMALSLDVGNPFDVHPRNKQEVSRRLALLALKQAYGHTDVEVSGPVMREVQLHGTELHVFYTHAKQLLARDFDSELRGFQLAGSDRRFHRAIARIDGDHVVVSSEAVPAPLYVRYAWDSAPHVNLVNEEGLPAVPFRNDDF